MFKAEDFEGKVIAEDFDNGVVINTGVLYKNGEPVQVFVTKSNLGRAKISDYGQSALQIYNIHNQNQESLPGRPGFWLGKAARQMGIKYKNSEIFDFAQSGSVDQIVNAANRVATAAVTGVFMTPNPR